MLILRQEQAIRMNEENEQSEQSRLKEVVQYEVSWDPIPPTHHPLKHQQLLHLNV
jgi:hypothetical protein